MGALARRHRWAGLVIDYEGLAAPAAAFTDFIDVLASELRRSGRQIVVAVPPPCGRSRCLGHENYDLDALAHAADQLVVMLYDHTVAGHGPVAPRRWFIDGLDRVRAAVAPDVLNRVAIGVPLYGRTSLSGGGDNGIVHAHVRRGCLRTTCFEVVASRFDPALLAHRASIRDSAGHTGTMTYEDRVSLLARLREVEARGFRRVALWRIGGEDPGIWDVLAKWRSAAFSSPRRERDAPVDE